MVSNYPNVYNGINVFIALEERRGEEEVEERGGDHHFSTPSVVIAA